MSFLFLMIQIALVIYVVKFFWDVTFGLLSLRSTKKAGPELSLRSTKKSGPELSVLDDILTAE